MKRLFEIWSSWAELAADLEKPYTTVQSWGQRGIPERHFILISERAAARGHSLTFKQLDKISKELRQKAIEQASNRARAQAANTEKRKTAA